MNDLNEFATGRIVEPMAESDVKHGQPDIAASTFLEARYEGTSDTSGVFARQGVIGVGRSVASHVRLTIEDGIARDSRTHNVLHFVAAFGTSNARLDGATY